LSTHEFASGELLAERYVLSRRLGQGATGAVWLARDRRLGVEVALKLLRPEIVERPGMFERFARESDLSVRMLSPNVVKVLGGGLTEAGVPYIVYEGLDGEELSAKLARTKRLSLGEMATVVTHLCRGLARAHAVGVLHCDIKPENTFLTKDTSNNLLVKILDFGVAELMAKRDANNPEQLCGTLEYLAPEVFLGERAPSPQSDLYSVGVVAYECCTGRRARPADTVHELVLSIARGPIESPAAHRLEVTPELDIWFAKALHHDPDQRFASAKVMAEELAGAMSSVRDRGSDRRIIDSEMRPRARGFSDEERVSSSYSLVAPRRPASNGPKKT
jgi:serine/threonine-protein kinase